MATPRRSTQALAGRRQTLGPQEADTLDTMAEPALTCQARGKFAPSEALARDAVDGDRKQRPNGWQRFSAESLLGASLAGQKKFAEAEPLLLAGYRRMKSRNEPDCSTASCSKSTAYRRTE